MFANCYHNIIKLHSCSKTNNIFVFLNQGFEFPTVYFFGLRLKFYFYQVDFDFLKNLTGKNLENSLLMFVINLEEHYLFCLSKFIFKHNLTRF